MTTQTGRVLTDESVAPSGFPEIVEMTGTITEPARMVANQRGGYSAVVPFHDLSDIKTDGDFVPSLDKRDVYYYYSPDGAAPRKGQTWWVINKAYADLGIDLAKDDCAGKRVKLQQVTIDLGYKRRVRNPNGEGFLKDTEGNEVKEDATWTGLLPSEAIETNGAKPRVTSDEDAAKAAQELLKEVGQGNLALFRQMAATHPVISGNAAMKRLIATGKFPPKS